MSTFERVKILAENGLQTQRIGYSLARSLYGQKNTIFLSGELGAGKTTFAQGFASGLGIDERVTSPTYALEQRYGGHRLSHIDLYRLSTAQAEEFVRTLDDFPGIRLIEWPERCASMSVAPSIWVEIEEVPEGRRISASCTDIAIPTDEDIQTWIADVGLPGHIVAHMKAVTDAAEKTADALLRQKRFVRRKALRAAALTHDLLRFVDFISLDGDASFTPTKEQADRWRALRERYGQPHEIAAQKYIEERGFSGIGQIVSTHRGLAKDGNVRPETIEQLALAYSDKRAMFDRPVTLDERFDDFAVRYGNGKESEYAKAWRLQMKSIEADLFPDGPEF